MIDERSQKEIIKEQFQLIAANVKNILLKRADKINNHEKELVISLIKKVNFIKSSFDIVSSTFSKIFNGVGLSTHQKNGIVFNKGDPGNHFFIVLEGLYCVEADNIKQGKKEKQIFYEAGDSFGEVSLIYDVPRGARIVADTPGSLITIKKDTFNECGDLRKNILYLNNFFSNHSYFEKEDNFMIRVVSSISKLMKFEQNDVIIEEGMHFHQILFFIKGEARVFKTLNLIYDGEIFSETIEIESLSEGDVYGQHFYTCKQPSTVRIVGIAKGQYIKVAFKDNIHSVENELYKRIRQNASKFPTDGQFLDQFKIYLDQKFKQISFLNQIYKNDKQKQRQKRQIKKKLNKILKSTLLDIS